MTGIIVPDGGTIGSASDTDALTITNTGVVKASQSIATSTIKDATGANNSISIATNGNLTFAGTVGNTGDNTITNGNLVIGTAGKGIDVSNASGSHSGSSSALLDDYEEGTWSPTFGSTIASNQGRYVKIGDLVFIQGDIINGDSGGHQSIGGLPFTTGNMHSAWHAGWTDGGITGGYFNTNTTSINSTNHGASTAKTWAAGDRALISGTYTSF